MAFLRDLTEDGYLAGSLSGRITLWAEMPEERNVKESLQIFFFFFSFLEDFEGCMHVAVKRKKKP